MALYKMVTVGLLFASLLGMVFGQFTECSEDWQSNNDSCWKLYTDIMNWTAAKTACRKVGAELASIHSDEEQEFVMTLIGEDYVWIGLAACEHWTEENYRWLYKNEFLTYNNFDEDQPVDKGLKEELCVLIDNMELNGAWHSYPCTYPASYLCKKPVQLKNCPRRA